jgi:Ankyrin repeats (3 copies)
MAADSSCEEQRMEVYMRQHQLMQACVQGHPAAVLDLFRRGASAARSDSSQSTPLHYACRSGSAQTVKAVLEAPGCDIDALDAEGRNAVFWACDAAKVDMLHSLRRAAQLSSIDNVGLVIAAVEQWQQGATNAEIIKGNAEVLAFLYGLRQELAAAEAQHLAAAGQQQRGLAVKQPAKACCICLEDIASTSISCSSGSHLLCIVCLDSYVAAETSSSKQRIAANKGKLCCPGDGCSNVFEHHLLAQHLPPETFGKLLAAWQACIEQAAMQTAAEQAKQELAREAAKDDVGKAKAHVLDSILMLKCPRCHKAFDDFDGCFAVHCRDTAGHGCGACFCGYCLKDCGNSKQTHAHVPKCAHNANRSLFGTKEDFQAAQCSRRRRMVLEYLETLPLRLRERVKPAIAPDLNDLGIDLSKEPQQQQPKKKPAVLQQQQQQPVPVVALPERGQPGFAELARAAQVQEQQVLMDFFGRQPQQREQQPRPLFAPPPQQLQVLGWPLPPPQPRADAAALAADADADAAAAEAAADAAAEEEELEAERADLDQAVWAAADEAAAAIAEIAADFGEAAAARAAGAVHRAAVAAAAAREQADAAAPVDPAAEHAAAAEAAAAAQAAAAAAAEQAAAEARWQVEVAERMAAAEEQWQAQRREFHAQQARAGQLAPPGWKYAAFGGQQL